MLALAHLRQHRGLWKTALSSVPSNLWVQWTLQLQCDAKYYTPQRNTLHLQLQGIYFSPQTKNWNYIELHEYLGQLRRSPFVLKHITSRSKNENLALKKNTILIDVHLKCIPSGSSFSSSSFFLIPPSSSPPTSWTGWAAPFRITPAPISTSASSFYYPKIQQTELM